MTNSTLEKDALQAISVPKSAASKHRDSAFVQMPRHGHLEGIASLPSDPECNMIAFIQSHQDYVDAEPKIR